MAAARWKDGERVYRQLLQLTGGHGDRAKIATTYSQLGMVEIELGSVDKAYKRFSKALELHPNHVAALRGMARVLEVRKDWQNLLNIYNNIIYHATNPQDAINAYMTKGRILDEEMGRPDKAVQHYERSLAFDANQPVALLRLSELALRREAWHEANGLAQRGLALENEPGPLRADLLLCWAVGKAGAGDSDGAEAAVVEARASNPELSESLGESPLSDLAVLLAGLRERLPR